MSPKGAGATLARWMMLVALALGVLAMHHVSQADDARAGFGQSAMAPVTDGAPGAHPDVDHDKPTPAGHNDLLHLCLAVVCAAVGLAIALWLIRTRREWFSPLAWSNTIRAAIRAPPPRWGRDILHSVCVLRV